VDNDDEVNENGIVNVDDDDNSRRNQKVVPADVLADVQAEAVDSPSDRDGRKAGVIENAVEMGH
jgi:hypothetical protein